MNQNKIGIKDINSKDADKNCHIEMTYENRSISYIDIHGKSHEISVDVCTKYEPVIHLEDEYRYSAMESIVFQMTGFHFSVYHGFEIEFYLIHHNCNAELSDDKILANSHRCMIDYWLSVFELVYFRKYGHVKTIKNRLYFTEQNGTKLITDKEILRIKKRAGIFARNMLLKLGKRSVDNELNCVVRKADVILTCEARPFSLPAALPAGKKSTKSFIRYYRRYADKFPLPTKDIINNTYFTTYSDDYKSEQTISEYCCPKITEVKVTRMTKNQSIVQYESSLKKNETKTSDAIRKMLRDIFNIGAFEVYYNNYTHILCELTMTHGKYHPGTGIIQISSYFPMAKNEKEFTIRFLECIFHEAGHQLFLKAKAGVTGLHSHIAHIKNASFENQANRFATWCLLNQGFTVDDLLSICPTNSNMISPTQKCRHKYLRLLQIKLAKNGKLEIPSDFRNIIRRKMIDRNIIFRKAYYGKLK